MIKNNTKKNFRTYLKYQEATSLYNKMYFFIKYEEFTLFFHQHHQGPYVALCNSPSTVFTGKEVFPCYGCLLIPIQ